MAQNIYDFLASEEIEKAQVARFDTMYAQASDEAKVNVDKHLDQFKSLKYMGDIGAKYSYMALYDFLNMTPQEQNGARMHGIQLLSIQPLYIRKARALAQEMTNDELFEEMLSAVSEESSDFATSKTHAYADLYVSMCRDRLKDWLSAPAL